MLNSIDGTSVVHNAALNVAVAILGKASIGGSDAESVAQEVVCDFLTRKCDIENPAPWAGHCARNKCTTLIRRAYVIRRCEARLRERNDAQIESPKTIAELNENAVIIRSCLAKLSPEHQAYLWAAYDEIPSTEMSQHLHYQRTPSHHRHVLRKARQALRRKLLTLYPQFASHFITTGSK